MMRTRMLFVLVFALVVATCGGSSSLGCRLQGVCPVVIDTQLAPDGPGGTFTVSGGGVICAEGTVTNLDSGFVTRKNSNIEGEEYFFEDEMVCADGAGSFVVRTHVDASAAGSERTGSDGEWEVLSGTGNYSELSGEGEYQSSSDKPCCSETYSGMMDRQDG